MRRQLPTLPILLLIRISCIGLLVARVVCRLQFLRTSLPVPLTFLRPCRLFLLAIVSLTLIRIFPTGSILWFVRRAFPFFIRAAII